MGSVTHTRNTRLGIKLGRAANRPEASIGWALLNRGRPKPASGREFGDVLALSRKAAQEQKNEGLALTLFSYLNDDAFAASQGAKDGLSRQDHGEMIEFVAAQLASEGFDIIVCEID